VEIGIPLTLDSTEKTREAGESFEEILRTHQSMVFSIAYHFLHDRAQAEDVAQEVFFRLSRRLSSIDSDLHLVRWLRKVTSRLCIDEIRRRPSTAPADLDELPGSLPSHDSLESDELRRLVAALPERARLAIILRYQEEMEPAEIARALNESVHTVKSRLQRALASLRERFTSREGEGT
jgi:RNA polymerase sigma-70 factor, ECF subfamily